MDNSSKKRIIALTVVAILLIGSIALFSYAIWTTSFAQDTNNLTTTGCFKVNFEEGNDIDLENAYPMVDEDGRQTSPYTVTIENTCTTVVQYNVISSIATTNTLDSSYVKVAIDNGEAKVLSSYNSVEYTVSGHTDSRLIGDGIVLPKQKKTIKIYEWLEESLTQESAYGKTFKNTITVTSAPTKNNLAATIINNNEIQTETVNFEEGSPSCDNSECANPTQNGNGLFAADDEEGTSYYFRGVVTNNNVTFAGKKWKILRINSNGSIRLVYNDENGPISEFNPYSGNSQEKDAGYTSNNSHHCTHAEPCYSDFQGGTFTEYYIETNTGIKKTISGNTDSSMKTALETWYISNLKEKDAQISLETYCNDTSIFEKNQTSINYGSMSRINSGTPSFICPDPTDLNSTNTHDYGGVYKLKIGLATIDEIIMAGISKNSSKRVKETNFLPYQSYASTMSPVYYETREYGSSINKYTYLYNIENGFTGAGTFNSVYKPILVINLKSDVKFTTNGTGDQGSSTNPYTID